jgi:hypothetical protein
MILDLRKTEQSVVDYIDLKANRGDIGYVLYTDDGGQAKSHGQSDKQTFRNE